MKKISLLLVIIMLTVISLSIVLAQQKTCPNCKAECMTEYKLCPFCGYKFQEPAPDTGIPGTQTGGQLVITKIEPLQGAPGSQVKISAQNVQAGNIGIYRVDFNGVTALIESIQSDGIYVIVPQNVTSGPVNVYVNNEQVSYTGYSYFTAGASPVLATPQATAGMTTTSLNALQQQTPVPVTTAPVPAISPVPTAPLSVTNIPAGTLSMGKIVYSSWDKNKNYEDIWVIKSGGKSSVNITHDTNYNTNPCWSPDGKLIAFTSTREGNREIYVMSQDGTQMRNLTGNSFWNDNPDWSPKNNKIAFESWRDGNLEIYTMNTDGRNQVNLTKTAKDDIEPSWSHDGTKIAFASNREQNFEIFIMNSDGSGQHNLTRAGTTDEKEPAWSPDGTRIAYTCHKDGQDDIYIMTAKGTNHVNITNNPISDDRSPCWSPDSKKIAFMSNRSTTAEANYWEICVINADGNKVFNLTNNSYWDGFPKWIK